MSASPKAVTVPKGMSAATYTTIGKALDALADTLDKAASAGNAVIVNAYGKDNDDKRDPRAAIRLAVAAAKQLRGGDKLRGGSQQAIASVLELVATMPDTVARDDRALVLAARITLDREAARKRDASAQRAQARQDVLDKSATADTRAAALEVLSGMDAADSAATTSAILASLDAAIARAVKAGVTVDAIAGIVASAYGYTIDATDSASVTLFAPVAVVTLVAA